MKVMSLNRLAALEKVRLRERPVHLLWVDHGDTDADVEERRNRLIAEGKASAADRFIRDPLEMNPGSPGFLFSSCIFQDQGARDGRKSRSAGFAVSCSRPCS